MRSAICYGRGHHSGDRGTKALENFSKAVINGTGGTKGMGNLS